MVPPVGSPSGPSFRRGAPRCGRSVTPSGERPRGHRTHPSITSDGSAWRPPWSDPLPRPGRRSVVLPGPSADPGPHRCRRRRVARAEPIKGCVNKATKILRISIYASKEFCGETRRSAPGASRAPTAERPQGLQGRPVPWAEVPRVPPALMARRAGPALMARRARPALMVRPGPAGADGAAGPAGADGARSRRGRWRPGPAGDDGAQGPPVSREPPAPKVPLVLPVPMAPRVPRVPLVPPVLMVPPVPMAPRVPRAPLVLMVPTALTALTALTARA